jgi:hypothetical protein
MDRVIVVVIVIATVEANPIHLRLPPPPPLRRRQERMFLDTHEQMEPMFQVICVEQSKTRKDSRE